MHENKAQKDFVRYFYLNENLLCVTSECLECISEILVTTFLEAKNLLEIM